MIKEEKNVQIANYEKWPDSPITMVNRHTGGKMHFNSTTSQLFEALLLSHALRLWQWNCIFQCFSIISDKIIGENGWQSETSVFLSQIQCHFSTISDQFWGGRVKLAGPLRLYFCLKSKVEMGCKVKLAPWEAVFVPDPVSMQLRAICSTFHREVKWLKCSITKINNFLSTKTFMAVYWLPLFILFACFDKEERK